MLTAILLQGGNLFSQVELKVLSREHLGDLPIGLKSDNYL